ncbi:MAG: hypothetical protein GC200_02785 [Tepidisphaera sp.]|nr:hypothetical protein [Tepidisphaera sp.]
MPKHAVMSMAPVLVAAAAFSPVAFAQFQLPYTIEAPTPASGIVATWEFSKDKPGDAPTGWKEILGTDPGGELFPIDGPADPALPGGLWRVMDFGRERGLRTSGDVAGTTCLTFDQPVGEFEAISLKFRCSGKSDLEWGVLVGTSDPKRPHYFFVKELLDSEPTHGGVFGVRRARKPLAPYWEKHRTPEQRNDLAARSASQIHLSRGEWQSLRIELRPQQCDVFIQDKGYPHASWIIDTSDLKGPLGVFVCRGDVDVKDITLEKLPKSNPNFIEFVATGMHCEMCEANIEGAIEKIKGVKKVTSSYKTGLVSVETDPASPPSNDAIIDAIKALKYGATVHTPGTAIPATPEPAAK